MAGNLRIRELLKTNSTPNKVTDILRSGRSYPRRDNRLNKHGSNNGPKRKPQ